METLVILHLVPGSFEEGFPVILEIKQGDKLISKVSGHLPANLQIIKDFEDGSIGYLGLNDSESLPISGFKEALQAARERGLQLAIFNSCDGLGLANVLAALNIPQIIVMREMVPDRVAQAFLQNFLMAFSRDNLSLYSAVREARRKLENFEEEFPGIKWLPVIFQHPGAVPPSWQEFAPSQVLQHCPYRGLSAFQEQHAAFFFGRERFTESLVAAVKSQSLVAVVGASGSGKSSVVFAGLIPQLRTGESWDIVCLRPGNRPFESLANALV